jgi:P27 family predicted phage terminase small subunit
MGSRGPLPKSVEAKKRDGTFRADREGQKPAVNFAPFNEAEPPDCLGKIGREKWDQTVAILLPSGLLTSADVDALLGYCLAFDRLAEYASVIAVEGEFQLLKNGCKVCHPAVARIDKMKKTIADFHKAFGMSPAARMRLTPRVAEPQFVDELDRLAMLFAGPDSN